MNHLVKAALFAGLFFATSPGVSLGEEKREQPRPPQTEKKEGEARKEAEKREAEARKEAPKREGEVRKEGDGLKIGQVRELEAAFKKFDTNGDKKLSPDEVKGTKIGKAFAQFDGNGDGFITFEELARKAASGEGKSEGESRPAPRKEGEKKERAKGEGEVRKEGERNAGEGDRK